MANFGYRGLNSNSYAYFETAAGASIAAGILDASGNYVIVPSLAKNADPSGAYVFQIENAANGNVNITPNGTGSVIISKILTPNLTMVGFPTGVMQTNAGGQVSSSAGLDGQLLISDTATSTPVWRNITAGANVTITNGANSITINANTGSETVNYTGINNTNSPYTVLATDYAIGADSTAGVISILLPNAPATGRIFVVKDLAGTAGTNNITVTTVGGAVNIDGATSFVMNTNYEAANLLFNGTSYLIF